MSCVARRSHSEHGPRKFLRLVSWAETIWAWLKVVYLESVHYEPRVKLYLKTGMLVTCQVAVHPSTILFLLFFFLGDYVL